MKPFRLFVLGLCTVFAGGVAYASMVLWTGPGSKGGTAYASATCQVAANSASEYTATVTLDPTASTILGQDSSGNLLVDGATCTGESATANLTSTTYISEITFTGTPPPTSQSVILDQTQPGGVFPCHTEIDGNLESETLQIDAAANEHVLVGSAGVVLNDVATCTDPVGALAGVGGYTLVGGTGAGAELDATGGKVSGSTTLNTGSPVVARFIAGDSGETFDAGVTGSSLDFSQLTCPSSPANPCSVTVNSTGSTVNGVPKFNAELFYGTNSNYTYNFTTGEALFTEVNGNTTIPTSWSAPASSTAYTLDSNVALQGSAGSYTVDSTGSGNQITAGSGTESFAVTGDNMVMTGANGTGSNTDTFTVTGSGNTFIAGTLQDNFYDAGTGNTVSFANIVTTSNALTIDADSSTTTDSNAGTAKVGSVIYTFLNASGATSDSNFTNFIGASTGNTIFQADSAGGLTFTGSQTSNTADFSKASTGITANLSGASITTPNNVPVASGDVLVTCGSTSCVTGTSAFDSISNVGTVIGATVGGNTFWGGSGTTSFTAKNSSNNTVNGASGGTYTVNMSGSSLTGNAINAGSGIEAFTVTGNNITMTGGTSTGAGSSTFSDTNGTGNHFVAGSLPDFFYDGGIGNTVDFSGVGTSPQDQLAVNVAGSPEAVTLTTTSGATPVTIQNGQAEVGTGTVYTFLNSSTATGTSAASDFTTLTGPTSGNTQFLGGSEFASGGPGSLTFTGGTGGNNSLAYPTVNSGVTVDLSNGPITGGTAYAAGFSATPDHLTDIATATGSPSGSNTFKAGGSFTLGSSNAYNFIGNGNNNTFTGGAGTDIFTSNGNDNTFQAGTGTATFNDPNGTGNTADFSPLTSATVTVNVTGGPVGSLGSTDEAIATFTSGSSKYFFSGFGANDATFIGASGANSQTTFLAGSSGDTFEGGLASAPADTLSFVDATGSSLQICIVAVSGTCSSQQALLGKVAENFNSGIKIFDGLGTGNTTFVAGDSTGGYTFNGAASGNTADFSSAAQPVQANLGTGHVTFTSGQPADTISNVTTVFGSNAGGNTFTAANSTETFGDRTTAFPPANGADTIDFSNLQTVPLTPLTVNANGGGTSPYTATFGQQTYGFATGGANFTVFKGAGGGFTTFVAGDTAGYNFTGLQSGNSIDFSADASPITANLTTHQVTLTGGNDTISGIPTVIGSPNGGNTFVVGTGQNETFKGGSNNTVDLSSLSSTAVVNVSQAGQSPQSTGFGTATSAGTIYDFTAFESSPTTFKGTTGGTTFYAGSSADTYIGESTNDTLSFADAQGTSLNLCRAASTNAGCAAGRAVLGTTTESFQSIKTFNGLATQGSTTTFYDDDSTGGETFNGQAGTNIADFTAASQGVVADMTKGTVTFAAGSPAAGGHDTIADVNTVYGSQAGGNTFVASPSSSETFGDFGPGSPLAGDAIDFTHILGTTTTSPLTVNPSLSTTLSGVAPYTAQFGSLTYGFATGGSNFTTFTGSASGNTTFQAAATSGGLTFNGNNVGNTADFSLTSGITAAITRGASPALNSGTVKISGVSVSPTDTLNGSFAKVVGSPNGPNEYDGDLTGTQFIANSSSNIVSYDDQADAVTVNLVTDQVSPSPGNGSTGTADSFSVPSTGSLTVVGSPANDTFQIGTRAVTIDGGGGQDNLDLSSIPPPPSGSTGVSVDLSGHRPDLSANPPVPAQYGSISSLTSGPSIGTVTFIPACGAPQDQADYLCVGTVTGTPESDNFIANQTLDGTYPTTITGGGGNDTLSLQKVLAPVVVDMPITTGSRSSNSGTCLGAAGLAAGNGDVCSGAASSPAVVFTGMQTVVGSQPGGDDFFAGQSAPSTVTITETGNPGTLDSSTIPSSNNSTDTIAGINIFANQGVGGSYSGTVTSSAAIGESIGFSNIGTFIGTQDNDTFTQSGPGPVTSTATTPPTGYVFDGRGGNNTVDLSAAPTGQLALSSPVAGDQCQTPPALSGIPNPNDVTDTVNGVAEQFTCVGSVTSSSSEYQVAPGQTATVNGGGSGTIDLVSPPGDPETFGCGVTVTMPVGSTSGSVTSNGCSDYNFKFTGVSTVLGTPYNDVFKPGSSAAVLEGNGGVDGVSYAGDAASAVINLSSGNYTVPTGYTNAGTVVPADAAIGGNGGNVALDGFQNAIASDHGDIIVGAPGTGTLVGGAGNDRFVPTAGGNDIINGANGTNTVDLSLLPGYTSLDLGLWGWQQLGPSAGQIALVPGTIQTAVGSPGGSALQAGNGDGITLVGSGVNDWLRAGVGNQTLIGNGPGTTLVGGVGIDTMQGGNYPVTFMPRQGTYTLTSPLTTGNVLSYVGVPDAVQVNLSNQLYSVPASEPSTWSSGPSLAPDTATGGYGATVYLANSGVSNVVGSSGNDILVTGAAGESVNGGGGDDLFVVNSGNDTLTAGNGSASRFLINGAGNNVIHGGGAATIDFSQVTHWTSCPAAPTVCVTVNLLSGNASGVGASERVDGVLNAIGSNGNDVLIAGAAHATLTGLSGTDVYQASPQGADTLDGTGGTNDTFCAEVGCNSMNYNPGAGSTLIGGFQSNSFFARNNVVDVIHENGVFANLDVDSFDQVDNP